MKTCKRLSSILLAVLMAVAMAIPAFAADTNTNSYTYEIYQIFTGDYSNGVLSNVKWGANAKIPTAAEGETQAQKGDLVPDSVLSALEDVVNETTDSEKLAVIKEYADLTGTPYTTASGTGINLTVTDLPNGYYLVKDKSGSVTGNDVYTTYVVRVVNGTLTIKRKGDVPDVEKKIVEGTDKKDTNEASIGDTVNYEITGHLPTNFADYKEYYYVFTDTLSKGLTYNNDVKVTVDTADGTDLTQYFYKNSSTNSETGETTIKVGIQDLKALNNLDNVNLTEASTIVVTYSAELNEDAKVGTDANTNEVILDYSNDPNNSGDGTKNPPPENPNTPPTSDPKITGVTPKDTVETYTTELTILKTDENGAVLQGAEFTLSGNGVNIVLVTSETFAEDASGDYWKLKDGTYTKTAPNEMYDDTETKYSYNGETDAYEEDPDGEYWKLKGGEYTDKAPTEIYDDLTTKYSKETELKGTGQGGTDENGERIDTAVVGSVDAYGEVTFTGLGAGTYKITETKTPDGYNTIAPIDFTISFDTTTKIFKSNNNAIIVGEDNKLDTTIKNKSGSTLPSTGGMGTTIFYVVGGILVVGAGLILVTKRRVSK